MGCKTWTESINPDVCKSKFWLGFAQLCCLYKWIVLLIVWCWCWYDIYAYVQVSEYWECSNTHCSNRSRGTQWDQCIAISAIMKSTASDAVRCWREIVFCFRWSSLLFHSFSTMDWVFQREKLRWWWKQVWQGGCHSCPQRTVSQYCSRCRVTHSYGISPVGRIILWSVTWLLENEKCWTLSCFTDPAPISPACRALSSKPASHRCCCRLVGPMDRQTDGRSTFHRPCSAYYVDSVSKCTSSLLNMILLYFVSVFKIVNLHFIYMPYFFTIFHQ